MNALRYFFSKVLKKIRIASIKNSFIDKTSKVEAGSSFVESSMDRYSFCGYDCDIFHADIGKFTSIANSVVIGGASHPMDWIGMSPVFYKGRDSVKRKFAEFELPPVKRVSIGSDVWIGRNAIILSGVRVGDGAVVGAGSVVTKDVAPYAIVAGNPAKLIRYRFDDEMVGSLLNKRWWDFDEREIGEMAQFCKNPDKAIDHLKGL